MRAADKYLVGAAVCFCALFVVPASLTGRTITVDDDGPADFVTIQAAIEDSNDGDTVVVRPGRYYENIDFSRWSGGKDVTLTSVDPNDPNIVATTIVDGQSTGRHSVLELIWRQSSSCLIAGLTLTNGDTWSSGGGVYGGSSQATISRCVIVGNRAKNGAGISNHAGLIVNCTISENTATSSSGGGLYSCDGTIAECIITGNSASGDGGGMVYCDGAVVECVISANRAGRNGGGMANCDANVLNCSVWGNEASGTGGGLADCYGDIANCVIVSNVSAGSAISFARGTVSNCVVWANTPKQAYYSELTYCCVEGGWSGEGNIDANPMFADLVNGDFHLLPGSPCVDSGDPNYHPPRSVTDIDGEARVMGAGVDMGVDELPGPLLPSISISPRDLLFTAKQSGANPPSQTMNVGNNGYGILEWNLNEDIPWLNAVPAEGISVLDPCEITLDASTAGLAWGQHTETISITDPCAANSPLEVYVTFVVVGPKIEMDYTPPLTLSANEGGPKPEALDITIRNSGGGTLFWSAVPDCNWLSAAPNSGKLRADETAAFAAVADHAGLAVGRYDCSITVSDPNAQVASAIVALTLFVKPSVLGANLRVPSEYGTIQAAADVAEDGDVIVVAPGTYTGPGNRDVDFKGKAVTVRGTDPNDPNVVAATIVDCNKLGRGFYLNGCAGATIQGLTITNGLARNGAGIYIEDSQVTVSKCNITNNSTTAGLPVTDPNGGDGGGIYCHDSSLVVSDCNVAGNVTGDGNQQNSHDPSDIPAIAYGARAGDGAGIFCSGDSFLEIMNSSIGENICGSGGAGGEVDGSGGVGGGGAGIYARNSATVDIRGSKISQNSAGRGGSAPSSFAGGGNGGCGGGICCSGGVTLSIIDSEIGENSTGQGGNTDGPGGNTGKGGHGGGIFCNESASLEIHNCRITNNNTSAGGENRPSTGGGGGICHQSDQVLVISDSVISHNTTTEKEPIGGYPKARPNMGDGGGIWCTSAVISGSSISNNVTADGESYYDTGAHGGHGGGIYCSDALELTDCTIVENRTGDGGDGDHGGGHGGSGGGVWADSVTAIECEISNNRTGDGGSKGIKGDEGIGGNGGGIYCREAVIDRCLMGRNETGNRAFTGEPRGGGSDGGGLFCSEQGTVSNTAFIANRTGDNALTWHGSGSAGGAVYSASISLSNCLFAGNSTGLGDGWYQSAGGEGGAIWCTSGTISNCTIADNSIGKGDVGESGGIHANTGGVTIADSIVWSNQPNQTFGIDCNNVSFSNIQDSNCVGSNGNISADPLFAPGPLGEYYLNQMTAGQPQDSPCINAGSDTAANLGLDIYTTRTDHSRDDSLVDIGYHYPRLATHGDVSYDGFVDWSDMAILADQWLGEPGDPSADTYPDNIVDSVDLAVIGDNWHDCLIGQAANPSPSDGAKRVDPNIILSWQPGAHSISHDVYFGTTDPPQHIGRQTEAFFDPGGLDPKTTYYWRIDEVGPRCITQGRTLSFTPEVFFEGEGTEESPYLIYDDWDMEAIGAEPNYWDKHFKLMADIDLSAYQENGWQIIGRPADWANGLPERPFTGTFDGNSHTISNFQYRVVEGQSHVGLFGYVNDGRIVNLGLIDPNVSGDQSYTGALVGSMKKGSVVGCYVEGGSISGVNYTGGLIGSMRDSSVSMCYANTALSSVGSSSGGLVGYNDGVIVDCYALGTVTGYSRAGGLVGTNRRSIWMCYSTGLVSAHSDPGGLVGFGDGHQPWASFWDTQTSGQAGSMGGEGKTTAEMMQRATFPGDWDFTNIWDIIEGETYPFLRTPQ